MEYKLVIDQQVVDEYNKHYFAAHPRARKVAIEKPFHPSLNEWIILPRIQMNALKQKWKEFGVWLCDKFSLSNLALDKFDIICTTFMPSRRRADPDNSVPKFILDSFTESGFIIDDSGAHLKSLTLRTDYDKNNPRLEIIINTIEE